MDGGDEDESTAYAAVSGMDRSQSTVISEDNTKVTTLSIPEKQGKDDPNTLSTTATVEKKKPKPRMASKSMKAEVKLAKTLFIIFIVFCVAWTPYAILCLYDKADTIAKEVYAISILILFIGIYIAHFP